MRRLWFIAAALLPACYSEPSFDAVDQTSGVAGSSGAPAATSTSGPDSSDASTSLTSNGTTGSQDDGSGSSGGDEPSTDDDGTPEPPPTTGGNTGGGSCECDDAPASEWSGPYLVYRGTVSEPPACPADQELVLAGGRGLVAPAASCGCECGVGSTECDGADDIEIGFHTSCADPQPEDNAELDECVAAFLPPVLGSAISADLSSDAFVAPLVGGSCDLLAQQQDVPAPYFEDPRVVCAPSDPAALCSDDGQCSASAQMQACIVRAGEHACEDSRFHHQTVIARQIEDDRGCTSCDCGSPTGYCEQRLALFADEVCSAQVTTVAGPGSVCIEDVRSARYELVAFAQCTAEGGVPTGSAAPADLHTLCCAS